MKYISWNKITKVSLTGLLICGATLCENAQAEENYTYSGVTENLINTTVDVDPPEFVSLTSDKTEVRSGERVNYTLKAKDNGKLTTASIVLKNDANGKTKSLYADSPTTDGTYSFTLEVDEKLSSGIWRLNEITLRDDSENYVDIYGEDALVLYSKPLKVDNNVTVDVDPPEFVSLASDKTEVRSGERVNYTLKAKDNGKLTTASIVLKNDANGKTKSLYADAPTTDGTYSFTLEVDEKLSSGIWRLNEITLRDDSDNYVDIYGEDALALYSKPLKVGESSLNNVSNNLQPDTESPKLISIKLNQTSATEHDVVTYTVDASDNRQLDSAYLTIRSVSSPSKYEILTGKLNKEGQLIFRYQVDENSFPGDWEISRLAIYDKAKNISEYNSENLPKESSPLLTISNNLQPDTEAPKLISIKLNQTNATEHDVVTYTIDASDNRQLDSAYLTIRPVSSPSKYEILTGKLNKEGQLIFRYQVDENSFPGDWEISRLAIYDKAKNISEYNSENLPKESSPILRVANRREISSLDSINSEKESTLSIHGINNVEKSKNDANILPTDSLSNNQPIDENSTAVKSPDKSDSENSATVQSPDKTSNENINTTQSPDKTDSENSTTVQSPDKIDSENSTAVQSPDKSDSENSATVQSPDKSDSENSATVQSPDKSDSENSATVQSLDKSDSENSATVQSLDKSDSENSATVQSPDKNNSESINMELYVQDELQNNGFSPYGEGNLFENANSDMIEKNNELKINQYPKRIERNLPKTGNKLFSVLSILGAISLLLILLRILMKTL